MNPRRPDLRDRLVSEGISLVSIDELRDRAQRSVGEVERKRYRGTGRIVALAEYRDGTIIDVIEGLDGRATVVSRQA